jgi:hypothetical protein
MDSFGLINTNKKAFNFANKKLLNLKGTKTYYFPCLTHKELLSINDLKHSIYYNSRTNKQNSNFMNFHTEVLKSNFKDNSKHLSLYKNLPKQNKSEYKFPQIKNYKLFKNSKMFNLYNNSNIMSLYNDDKINKNMLKNNKILKYNKTTNRFNMSNISTSGNISSSLKSNRFSKLNKIESNSADLNNNSYININKYNNNSNNNLDNNSCEQRMITYKSNNTSSSLNKINKFKTFNSNDNLLLTKSNSNISYINDNIKKKFLSNLNPIYTLLKKEFLSEFNRKTKDISYLKYIFMQKKIDIELEKEKRISYIEKQNLNNFHINMLYYFFNKYNDSKLEYFNYLKKTITKEKEKKEKLKEDKITIMNDIYTIRHKTLRLENRFRYYLNDKYFLLSVKNHSFTLNKFTEEDQNDYNKDLKKLDILNVMLKVTEREYQNKDKDKDNEKKTISKRESTKRLKIMNINKTSFFNNNIIKSPKSPIKSFIRQNTKYLEKNYYSLYGSRAGTQKNLIKTTFKAMPIYNDPEDFKRDLQQTSNNIQFSLVEYNEISKELQIMRNKLYQDKIKMKNIEKYENYIKEEIVIYKKNLENLKNLNLNLKNYQKYLLNIDVLNLNKGKVNFRINKILKNIYNSKDEILLNYLDNAKGGTGLKSLFVIEKALEFLLKYKEIQKNNNNIKYINIQAKIEAKNRIKYSKYKQDNMQKKIDSLINKVINKNKKIIFFSRRKVNNVYNGFNPEIHNKKKYKKDFNINNYFGDFDLD